ncbi:MAG: DUF1499 domain-containing protein [Alphaproteobacteria bacterium]|nr:DUF1499 domain-containing protein [Alphaproteobacteria bacterium]
MFGPPDLGPVEFERLARRSTPNDALACPAGLCAARIDLEPPTYAVDAAALRAALAAVIAGEPKTERVAADDATLTDRYVQRTALMGFPDTIVVRALEQPGGRSTLAIYARSQLGRSDLGANRARIERWLAKLGDKVPIVR